jgi:DNA-binding transcriptional regulator YiaG
MTTVTMEAMTAEELRRIRRDELGVTQAQLAEMLHRTPVRVSQWETGRGTIPPLVADHLRMLVSRRRRKGAA